MDRSKPAADLVSDVLAHHGIKGMKWGVRRKNPSAVTVIAKDGKKIKVSGGVGQPAHEDAILAKTAKQKAKKSSTDSLSNKELQALVTRLNLEQQLSKLGSGQKSAGAKFVTDVLVNVGKQQVTKAVNDQVSKQIAVALNKK